MPRTTVTDLSIYRMLAQPLGPLADAQRNGHSWPRFAGLTPSGLLDTPAVTLDPCGSVTVSTFHYLRTHARMDARISKLWRDYRFRNGLRGLRGMQGFAHLRSGETSPQLWNTVNFTNPFDTDFQAVTFYDRALGVDCVLIATLQGTRPECEFEYATPRLYVLNGWEGDFLVDCEDWGADCECGLSVHSDGYGFKGIRDGRAVGDVSDPTRLTRDGRACVKCPECGARTFDVYGLWE